MYWIYVLKSTVAAKSYVGHTNDLGRRLEEHSAGRNFYTRRYVPWEMIYTEQYSGVAEAVQREKFLKSTQGRRFLKKVFEEQK